MALRVLLADESSTIKKVFQLALQDYGVEVRPVNIGVDVAMVAKGFKPDIIFADVMLQKKNGYDVCAELKQDAALRGIPFVLMWSGFVDLDEDKFQASAANAQLEKPFDVAALRKLVSDLVPRTQSQSLSQYLTFPKGTVEPEKRPEMLEPSEPPPLEEDFQQVPIPKMKGNQTEKYRLNLKPEELDPTSMPVEFDEPSISSKPPPVPPAPAAKPPPAPVVSAKAPEQPATMGSAFAGEVELDDDDEISEFAPRGPRAPLSPKPFAPAKAAPPKAAPKAASEVIAAPAGLTLTPAELEKIIRAQSAEVIESVVWKVIPELATQIIERELAKLLKERDANPY